MAFRLGHQCVSKDEGSVEIRLAFFVSGIDKQFQRTAVRLTSHIRRIRHHRVRRFRDGDRLVPATVPGLDRELRGRRPSRAAAGVDGRLRLRLGVLYPPGAPAELAPVAAHRSQSPADARDPVCERGADAGQPADRLGRRLQGRRGHGLGGVLRRDGDGDGFFVDVQADVMHDFVHGCLVSLSVINDPASCRVF